MATRSYVRVVTRNSSRTCSCKQIQNYRVMQSYIYRWIEIYWDAFLSLVFQVGGVSEIVIRYHCLVNFNQAWIRMEARRVFYDSKAGSPRDYRCHQRNTWSIKNHLSSNPWLQSQQVTQPPRVYVAITYLEDRFEINDRKGLEIVVLTALLTFQDTNDAQRHPDQTPSLPPPSIPANKSTSPARVVRTLSDMPPPPPPKPAPRTGVDGIAEMQAMKGDYNEIIISVEGDVHDYAEYCNNLLQVCAADWFIVTSFITLLSGRCYVVHHSEVWRSHPSA